jgi:hypothetical protein
MRFLEQEAGGDLRRVKELLPVYFDLYQVYTLEGQRGVLLLCNLEPTLESFRVTFRAAGMLPS